MTERIDIKDSRFSWKKTPPLITINGLEYYLLTKYVANRVLQIVEDGEKTQTPISDMKHALQLEILDHIFSNMSMFEYRLGIEYSNMTIFSSLTDTDLGKSAYVDEMKRANKAFFRDAPSGVKSAFPYQTKFFQSPRFNLIDGFWHPAENGEYEDVFCCMEMVPIACSIRFKSLLPS